MAWILPAAILGGAAISGGLSYMGASGQAKASAKAAQAQSEATNKSLDFYGAYLNQAREDVRPWREKGQTALNQLSTMLQPGGYLNKSYTASDLTFDPGYQFRLQQGINALNRGSLAEGGFFGGNRGTALVDYGQSAGSNEFSNAYNRYTGQQSDLYNRLYGMANMGYNAANSMSSTGITGAGGMSNLMTQGGNASAMGTIGGANAWSNMYSQLGNTVMQGAGMGLGAYQQNKLINSLNYGGNNTGMYGGYGGSGNRYYLEGVGSLGSNPF